MNQSATAHRWSMLHQRHTSEVSFKGKRIAKVVEKNAKKLRIAVQCYLQIGRIQHA